MTGIAEVKELQFRSKTSTTFHLYLCGVFLHSKCLSSASGFTSATLSSDFFLLPLCNVLKISQVEIFFAVILLFSFVRRYDNDRER